MPASHTSPQRKENIFFSYSYDLTRERRNAQKFTLMLQVPIRLLILSKNIFYMDKKEYQAL